MSDEPDSASDVAAVVDDVEGRNGQQLRRPLLVAAIAVSVAVSLVLGVDRLAETFSRAEDNTDRAEHICELLTGEPGKPKSGLKYNLQLFLDDHIALHRHVNLPIHHGSNIDEIQASIDALTPKICRKDLLAD
jgi:hypothetical protein